MNQPRVDQPLSESVDIGPEVQPRCPTAGARSTGNQSKKSDDEQPDRARGRDPLSKAQAIHAGAPSRATSSAAVNVLRSSIAIVIGPTPPGTGVIAPATSTAWAKSTSP